MKTLFFVGNKRSGTTLLMRLLNLHPNVFVSNESDIVWILYLFHNSFELKPYPYDSPKGFNNTLKNYQNLLRRDNSPFENFETVLRAIMIDGFNSLAPQKKENICVLGDQKMFQHCDPSVVPFILREFPNPHFIHIVRHPLYVIESQQNFANDTGANKYDNIWNGKEREELLKDWAKYEKQVEEIKNNYDLKIIDIRYEDLIDHPTKTIELISDFLNLAEKKEIVKNSRVLVTKKLRFLERVDYPSSVVQIMNQYNYQGNVLAMKNKTIVAILNLYYKLSHKLKNAFNIYNK